MHFFSSFQFVSNFFGQVQNFCSICDGEKKKLIVNFFNDRGILNKEIEIALPNACHPSDVLLFISVSLLDFIDLVDLSMCSCQLSKEEFILRECLFYDL